MLYSNNPRTEEYRGIQSFSIYLLCILPSQYHHDDTGNNIHVKEKIIIKSWRKYLPFLKQNHSLSFKIMPCKNNAILVSKILEHIGKLNKAFSLLGCL